MGALYQITHKNTKEITMKRVILLSIALASFLVAADQQKPLTKEEQEYNEKVFKRIDDKISEIYKRLDEAKNAKEMGGGTHLDATTLPLMQGSYSISKSGKQQLSEVYVQDSGGGDMYLNKGNNMIISTISDDHTTYKTRGTTVKTPVVYNNNAPKAQTAIKPEINTFSQQGSVSSSLPTNLLPPPPLPRKDLE